VAAAHHDLAGTVSAHLLVEELTKLSQDPD
jgi:hypothetical protein